MSWKLPKHTGTHRERKESSKHVTLPPEIGREIAERLDADPDVQRRRSAAFNREARHAPNETGGET